MRTEARDEGLNDDYVLTEDDLPEVDEVEAFAPEPAPAPEDGRRRERRSGPDDLAQAPDWISATGWGVAIVSFVLFGLAKPEDRSMFDRFMGVAREAERWDAGLLRGAVALDVLAILAGVFALSLNLARLRRTEDRVRLAPIVLLVLCAAGLFALVDKL